MSLHHPWLRKVKIWLRFFGVTFIKVYYYIIDYKAYIQSLSSHYCSLTQAAASSSSSSSHLNTFSLRTKCCRSSGDAIKEELCGAHWLTIIIIIIIMLLQGPSEKGGPAPSRFWAGAGRQMFYSGGISDRRGGSVIMIAIGHASTLEPPEQRNTRRAHRSVPW